MGPTVKSRLKYIGKGGAVVLGRGGGSQPTPNMLVFLENDVLVWLVVFFGDYKWLQDLAVFWLGCLLVVVGC